jgi:radical SAM superfamily enzyme YgiQ (UPF0313 family)
LKVLLVSANTEELNMRALPWGLACVASACREAGHNVLLLDLLAKACADGVAAGAIASFAPDVIGISVRNVDDQRREKPTFFLEKVKRVVEECRRSSAAPIVLGGAGYSIFPESALRYLGADMGIQGEGERAFPELLGRLERGEDLTDAPGLYLRAVGPRGRRQFVRDLGTLPLPGDELLGPYSPADDELWIPLQARRGCAMNCSYCSTGTIEGRDLRLRPASQVVDWIERCAARGFRRFFFVDNAFNIPASLGREVCSEILRRGTDVTWRCILNPMSVDEDLVAEMAKAGCTQVSLGFESGCDHVLREMNKKFTAEQVRRAARLLHEHGIIRMGFLLLGGPGETVESAEKSLAFADSLDLEAVRVTLGIRIYPGTQLARRAAEDGIIGRDDDLLRPAFYVARGIDSRLSATLGRWKSAQPNWIF